MGDFFLSFMVWIYHMTWLSPAAMEDEKLYMWHLQIVHIREKNKAND